MFHHIELYKYRAHHQSLFDYGPVRHFISNIGKNGVYIFFVLSGFLITYLLLAEKAERQTIALKKFYIRRILRIWPLYYFIVLLSFVVLPLLAQNIPALRQETYYYKCIASLLDAPWLPLVLFLVFLPNLALKLRPPVAGASQSWSVGVEEQFYLIWPQLIQRIAPRYLLYVFCAIALLPVWVALVGMVSPSLGNAGKAVIGLLPIHLMAVGGIGGLLYFFHKQRLAGLLTNGFLFLINTLLFLALLFFPAVKLLFGFVVMLEILFVIQDGFRVNLRNGILDKLGEISYGIYMYHPIVMYLSFTAVHTFIGKSGTAYHIVVYIVVTLLTFLVSHYSYQYLEKRFIRYKNKKFTIIESGNPAATH